MAFHAQQAAEKALKALLVAHEVSPPRTHDLAQLLVLLPVAPPIESATVEPLTDYAVVPRYPTSRLGDVAARDALELAHAVVTAVRQAFG